MRQLLTSASALTEWLVTHLYRPSMLCSFTVIAAHQNGELYMSDQWTTSPGRNEKKNPGMQTFSRQWHVCPFTVIIRTQAV